VEALALVVDRQKALIFVDGQAGPVHRMSSTDQKPPA
jgi:hypothetical protein